MSVDPTRRSVVRGVAWTIPVVATAAASPAFAASPCTVAPVIPPFPASGTSNANWLITTSGLVFSGSARFASGAFVVDTDPALFSAYTATATYRGPAINLTANFHYRFTVNYTVFAANTLTAFHDLLLGGSVVRTFDTDTTTTAGSYVVSYTPASTGPLTLAVRFRVTGTTTTVGDDITVTSLVASC